MTLLDLERLIGRIGIGISLFIAASLGMHIYDAWASDRPVHEEVNNDA